jgi:hypothetical protein
MPRDTVFSTSSDDRLLPVDWTRLLDDLYAGRHGDYRLDPAVPVVRGQHAVAVHWTRGGGFVQLGPTARAEDGTDVEVPGHWVDLDWAQTNRLIRFLRNARDQAFGRPE